MCDRQTSCPGCLGKSITRDPFVLQFDVSIQDCPLYKARNGKAYFERYSSTRTSSIFFENFNLLSSNVINLAPSIHKDVTDKVNKMVANINENGGWTVAGWHRQGVKQSLNGEDIMSDTTKGHITYLYPTKPEVLDSDAYKELLIETPTDNSAPVVANTVPQPAALVSPIRTRTGTNARQNNNDQGGNDEA